MMHDKAFLEKILHGVAEIAEAGDGSYRLFRVPQKLFPQLNQRVTIRSSSPSGVELRFRMGDSPVRFTIRRMPEPNHPLFTSQTAVTVGIVHGDFQYSWLALQEGDNEIDISPFHDPSGVFARNRNRFSPDLTRIVLPPFIELRIVGWTGEMEPPRPEDSPQITYLAYGSSITQGAYTPLGNMTYPAVIGQELGVDVLNLGIGGGAALEPEFAQWIISRSDWNFASLEMGVNIFGLTPEEFRTRVRGFLTVFAADPRKRPVFCMDMLPFGGEIGGDAEHKEKAEAFRRAVREETTAAGSPAMFVLEYASLIPRVSDYAYDLLHPASRMFESLGCGLAAQIKNVLQSKYLNELCEIRNLEPPAIPNTPK